MPEKGRRVVGANVEEPQHSGGIEAPPRKAAVVAFTSAAMGPIALAAWVAAAGTPIPSLNSIPAMTIPNFICAAIASLAVRMIYQLGTDLAKARQMGRYRLESLFGRGGMGEVWLARHRTLARPAAIKLLRPWIWGGDSDMTVLRRFERETQVTAGLSCPHTIRPYDFGRSQDGTFYYVMELLDGIDLDSLVRRFGPVAPERAVLFLQQACCSLAGGSGLPCWSSSA